MHLAFDIRHKSSLLVFQLAFQRRVLCRAKPDVMRRQPQKCKNALLSTRTNKHTASCERGKSSEKLSKLDYLQRLARRCLRSIKAEKYRLKSLITMKTLSFDPTATNRPITSQDFTACATCYFAFASWRRVQTLMFGLSHTRARARHLESAFNTFAVAKTYRSTIYKAVLCTTITACWLLVVSTTCCAIARKITAAID